MPAVDLSEYREAAKQAAANGTAEPANDEITVVEAEWAFMVYKMPDGRLVMTNNINEALVGPAEDVEVEDAATGETHTESRYTQVPAPTHDEVNFALTTLQKDILVQQIAVMSANAVVQVQMAQMQQMQGNAELQQVLQNIQKERKGP